MFKWNEHWYSIRQDSDHKRNTHDKNANILEKKKLRHINKCSLKCLRIIIRHLLRSKRSSMKTKGPKTVDFEGRNIRPVKTWFDAITDSSETSCHKKTKHTIVLSDCGCVSLAHGAKQRLFLIQASVKSWSCDSSWTHPLWELIQWRSEALSDHSFTVKLKHTGN